MQPLNAFLGLHALILLLLRAATISSAGSLCVCEKPFLPNIFYRLHTKIEIYDFLQQIWTHVVK